MPGDGLAMVPKYLSLQYCHFIKGVSNYISRSDLGHNETWFQYLTNIRYNGDQWVKKYFLIAGLIMFNDKHVNVLITATHTPDCRDRQIVTLDCFKGKLQWDQWRELVNKYRSFMLINLPCSTSYHKTSNINRTLQCNKIFDHSDVVGQAMLQLHLHTWLSTWLQWIG